MTKRAQDVAAELDKIRLLEKRQGPGVTLPQTAIKLSFTPEPTFASAAAAEGAAVVAADATCQGSQACLNTCSPPDTYCTAQTCAGATTADAPCTFTPAIQPATCVGAQACLDTCIAADTACTAQTCISASTDLLPCMFTPAVVPAPPIVYSCFQATPQGRWYVSKSTIVSLAEMQGQMNTGGFTISGRERRSWAEAGCNLAPTDSIMVKYTVDIAGGRTIQDCASACSKGGTFFECSGFSAPHPSTATLQSTTDTEPNLNFTDFAEYTETLIDSVTCVLFLKNNLITAAAQPRFVKETVYPTQSECDNDLSATMLTAATTTVITTTTSNLVPPTNTTNGSTRTNSQLLQEATTTTSSSISTSTSTSTSATNGTNTTAPTPAPTPLAGASFVYATDKCMFSPGSTTAMYHRYHCLDHVAIVQSYHVPLNSIVTLDAVKCPVGVTSELSLLTLPDYQCKALPAVAGMVDATAQAMSRAVCMSAAGFTDTLEAAAMYVGFYTDVNCSASAFAMATEMPQFTNSVFRNGTGECVKHKPIRDIVPSFARDSAREVETAPFVKTAVNAPAMPIPGGDGATTTMVASPHRNSLDPALIPVATIPGPRIVKISATTDIIMFTLNKEATSATDINNLRMRGTRFCPRGTSVTIINSASTTYALDSLSVGDGLYAMDLITRGTDGNHVLTTNNPSGTALAAVQLASVSVTWDHTCGVGTCYIVCTDPGTTGYIMTNTELNVATGFDVTGVCATGYSGTVTATPCGSSGDYSVSGCSATEEGESLIQVDMLTADDAVVVEASIGYSRHGKHDIRSMLIKHSAASLLQTRFAALSVPSNGIVAIQHGRGERMTCTGPNQVTIHEYDDNACTRPSARLAGDFTNPTTMRVGHCNQLHSNSSLIANHNFLAFKIVTTKCAPVPIDLNPSGLQDECDGGTNLPVLGCVNYSGMVGMAIGAVTILVMIIMKVSGKLGGDEGNVATDAITPDPAAASVGAAAARTTSSDEMGDANGQSASGDTDTAGGDGDGDGGDDGGDSGGGEDDGGSGDADDNANGSGGDDGSSGNGDSGGSGVSGDGVSSTTAAPPEAPSKEAEEEIDASTTDEADDGALIQNVVDEFLNSNTQPSRSSRA